MKDNLPKSEFSADPVPVPQPEPLAPPSETRRTVTEDRYTLQAQSTPKVRRRA